MLSFTSHTEGSALSARQGENSFKRTNKTPHNLLNAILVISKFRRQFRQQRAQRMFGEYANQSIDKGITLSTCRSLPWKQTKGYYQ